MRVNGLFCQKYLDLLLMRKGFVTTSWHQALALECLCGVRVRSLLEEPCLLQMRPTDAQTSPTKEAYSRRLIYCSIRISLPLSLDAYLSTSLLEAPCLLQHASMQRLESGQEAERRGGAAQGTPRPPLLLLILLSSSSPSAYADQEFVLIRGEGGCSGMSQRLA